MAYDKLNWQHQKSLEICLLNSSWFEKNAAPIVRGMVVQQGITAQEITAVAFSPAPAPAELKGLSRVFLHGEVAEKFQVPRSHFYAENSQTAKQYINQAKSLLQVQKNQIQQIVKASLERNQEHLSSADLEDIAEPLREFAANYYLKIKKNFEIRIAQLEESYSPRMIAKNQDWAAEANQEDQKRKSVDGNVPWTDKHATTSEVTLSNNAKGYISTGPGAFPEKQEDRAILADIPTIHPSWENRIPELLQLTAQTLAVEIAQNCPAARDSGCTGSFLFIYKNKAYVCWVGDSPVIKLTTKDGKTTAEYLNYSHHADPDSIFGQAEIERVSQEGGRVEGKRVMAGVSGLAVSRAFGDQHIVGVSGVASINVTDISAEKGVVTEFIVASDGLTDHMTLKEIAELRQKHRDNKTFTSICRALAEEKAFNFYYLKYKEAERIGKLKIKKDCGEPEILTEDEVREIEQTAERKAQNDIDNTTMALSQKGVNIGFDGHSSDKVAEYASKNIMRIMSNLAKAPAPRSVSSVKGSIEGLKNKIEKYLPGDNLEGKDTLNTVKKGLKEIFDIIENWISLSDEGTIRGSNEGILAKEIENLIMLKLLPHLKEEKDTRAIEGLANEIINALKEMYPAEQYDDYPELANILIKELGAFAILPKIQNANDYAYVIREAGYLNPEYSELKALKDGFIKISNEIWEPSPFNKIILDRFFHNNGKVRQIYLENCQEFLKGHAHIDPHTNANQDPSLEPITFKDNADYKLRQVKFSAVKLIAEKKSGVFQTKTNKDLLKQTEKDINAANNIEDIVEKLKLMANDYEPRNPLRRIINALVDPYRGKILKGVIAEVRPICTDIVEEVFNIENQICPPRA